MTKQIRQQKKLSQAAASAAFTMSLDEKEKADTRPMPNHEQTDDANTAPQINAYETLGLCLKKARESQHKSIEDVASTLRIQAHNLQALEDGDWDRLPGETYAIGFAKQYAVHLKLDVQEQITQLKSENFGLTKPLIFPDQPTAPNKKLGISSALLFIAIFVIANVYFSENPSSPDTTTTTIEQDASVSSTNQTSSPTPEQIQKVPEQPVKATASPVAVEIAKQTDTTTSAPNATASLDPAAFRYTFIAKDSIVWMQLFDPKDTNTAMRDVTLQPGERFTVSTDISTLLLTTGNAPALQVLINDQTLHILDATQPEKQVLHKILLQIE